MKLTIRNSDDHNVYYTLYDNLVGWGYERGRIRIKDGVLVNPNVPLIPSLFKPKPYVRYFRKKGTFKDIAIDRVDPNNRAIESIYSALFKYQSRTILVTDGIYDFYEEVIKYHVDIGIVVAKEIRKLVIEKLD